MNFETIEEVKAYDPQLVHANNLLVKLNQKRNHKLTTRQERAIENIISEYLQYIGLQCGLSGFSAAVLRQRVDALNQYYRYFETHEYDNVFSAQGKFRPTILEEFMYILFKDMILFLKRRNGDEQNVLRMGSVKAYNNLYFKSQDLNSFIHDIHTGVNVKDQDFAIYREMVLSINDVRATINLPIIAVEVKTNLDKTMLEGAIATAEKIKMGNPYARFFVVTENYDVDLNVDPAYSRIDQIFVLRKTKRKTTPKPDICYDVVKLFVDEVYAYLGRRWGDLEHKLDTQGILI